MQRNQYTFGSIILLAILSAFVVFVWGPSQKGPNGQPLPRPRLGLDLKGGVRVVLEANTKKMPAGKEFTADTLDSVVKTIRDRVDARGISEPVIQKKPPMQIIVELPGVKDPEEAISYLKATASLEFYHLKDVVTELYPLQKYRMNIIKDPKTGREKSYEFVEPSGEAVTSQKDIMKKIIGDKPPVMTGADLLPECRATIGPSQQIEVQFKCNNEGTVKFRNFTRKHVGQILAIVFDGKIISAPFIKDAIVRGEGNISGGFNSLEEATSLANLLNAGALPVPLNIVQKQTVEPTLGEEYVQKSKVAGIVGLALVLLFMLIYYRLPGLVANVALCFYSLFVFAILILFGATLTLPGLAGFILSVGMAVDANVLIFERLKEELREGKLLRTAIEDGFKRARTAIIDSNACTLITCLILYIYGSGPVKGFALTLAIGVLTSLFTAITVTRTILHLLVNFDWALNEKLYGLGQSWVSRLGFVPDVVGKRNYYFAFSGILLILGISFWAAGGLHRGIEFTGGSSLQIQFQERIPQLATKLNAVLDEAGLKGGQVQISEGNTAFVRTKELKNSEELENLIRERVGEFKRQEFSSVGATISKELTHKAGLAIVYAAVLIMLYLAFRFQIGGGFMSGIKYGVCAIVASCHDAIIITGMFALAGKLLGWQIDSLFITALLTIIGFSTHDTIVVFDRIRENLGPTRRVAGNTFENVANKSILQTFSRSVNTSFTVLLTVAALIIFGGAVIRHFNWALFIGIIIGTYSSIFNAAQLVVVWESRSRGRTISARRTLPGDLRTIAPAPTRRTVQTDEVGAPPAAEAEAPAREAKPDTGRIRPTRAKRRRGGRR